MESPIALLEAHLKGESQAITLQTADRWPVDTPGGRFYAEMLSGTLKLRSLARANSCSFFKIEITSRSLPQMWDEFSKFLTSVRSISMDTDQSTLALNTVLRLPAAKPDDKKARVEGLKALSLDLSARLTGYQKELGKLTLSHLMFVSPSGQRAAVCLRLSALRSGCLGSRHSLKLAVFNTLTDIAARPPENAYFQKDRDTIEKRSGRWLKE